MPENMCTHNTLSLPLTLVNKHTVDRMRANTLLVCTHVCAQALKRAECKHSSV